MNEKLGMTNFFVEKRKLKSLIGAKQPPCSLKSCLNKNPQVFGLGIFLSVFWIQPYSSGKGRYQFFSFKRML